MTPTTFTADAPKGAVRETCAGITAEAGHDYAVEGGVDLPMGERGRAAFEATPGCELFVLLTEDAQAKSGRTAGETLARFTEEQPAEVASHQTAETDTAVVLYTSGTIGQPKGAELIHSNLVHIALLCNRLLDTRPHDVHLVTLPLFHTFGQCVLMNTGFAAGAALVVVPGQIANLPPKAPRHRWKTQIRLLTSLLGSPAAAVGDALHELTPVLEALDHRIRPAPITAPTAADLANLIGRSHTKKTE